MTDKRLDAFDTGFEHGKGIKISAEEPKRKPIGEIYWEKVESRDEWEMVLVFRTGLLSGDEIRLAPVTGILMATVPNKELFTKLIKTFEIE